MNTEELQILMRDSAKDAANFAQEQFDIQLNGSIESVAKVDEAILRCAGLLKSQDDENKFVFTVCNIFGAYVGEIYREIVGGTWVYDTTDPSAPTVMLAYGDRTYAFAGMCYEKLVKNIDQSVRKYFELAVANNTQ